MFNVSRPGGFEVFSHMMVMVSLVKLEHSKSVGQSSPPATKYLAGYCQQLPFRVVLSCVTVSRADQCLPPLPVTPSFFTVVSTESGN